MRQYKSQQNWNSYRLHNITIPKSVWKYEKQPPPIPNQDFVRPLTYKLQVRCPKCRTGCKTASSNCRLCRKLMIQKLEECTSMRIKRWREVSLKKSQVSREKIEPIEQLYHELKHQRLVRKKIVREKETKFQVKAHRTFNSTFGRRKVVENVGTGSHFFLSVLSKD